MKPIDDAEFYRGLMEYWKGSAMWWRGMYWFAAINCTALMIAIVLIVVGRK